MTHRYLDRVYLREPVPAGSYLAALPAVRALGDREHPLKIPAPVTFLVGENGTGKSTLLEAVAVACGFNAEGGTRNFSFSTRETHSPLYRYLTVGRTAYPRDGFFLRAESFYNVATNIDEMDEEPGPGGSGSGQRYHNIVGAAQPPHIRNLCKEEVHHAKHPSFRLPCGRPDRRRRGGGAARLRG